MMEITKGELTVILEALLASRDEIDSMVDQCDLITTSGALELIEDSLLIVTSILDVAEEQELKQLEEELNG